MFSGHFDRSSAELVPAAAIRHVVKLVPGVEQQRRYLELLRLVSLQSQHHTEHKFNVSVSSGTL